MFVFESLVMILILGGGVLWYTGLKSQHFGGEVRGIATSVKTA